MYRYSVDNAVTYTSEDLVLFRESPFACWMERLTLENPEHGIPPDIGSTAPGNTSKPQDELADTLRAEGKQVTLVDWHAEEPQRRRATLEAMRTGIDFIVNGQLALGPLSGSANLLMRTSGYSEFGNYLYIPCDTQAKTTIHSAFRLCFLADLLHSLQGQLPGQMLIIRGDTDLVPLHTEDHIYHYRAVKQRFMTAMREFRKHRMPDPAESSHFGRWSECANEVMKQRALRDEQAGEAQQADAAPDAASSADQEAEASADEALMAASEADAVLYQNPIEARLATSRGLKVSGTLADQARSLPPSTALTPGPVSARAAPSEPSPPGRRAIDSALQDLSFIGRSRSDEPSAVKRHPLDSSEQAAAAQAPPPVQAPADAPAPPTVAADPETWAGPQGPAGAVSRQPGSDQVDRDTPVPFAETPAYADPGSGGFEVDCIDDSDYRLPGAPPDFDEPVARPSPRPFSDSLNTAGEDRD